MDMGMAILGSDSSILIQYLFATTQMTDIVAIDVPNLFQVIGESNKSALYTQISA